jgi:hypothetical protein
MASDSQDFYIDKLVLYDRRRGGVVVADSTQLLIVVDKI